jgi:hypothetical protein
MLAREELMKDILGRKTSLCEGQQVRQWHFSGDYSLPDIQ